MPKVLLDQDGVRMEIDEDGTIILHFVNRDNTCDLLYLGDEFADAIVRERGGMVTSKPWKYQIGTVIDRREDKSFVYMSHKGVLNLDDRKELEEAIAEDESFLGRRVQGP